MWRRDQPQVTSLGSTPTSGNYHGGFLLSRAVVPPSTYLRVWQSYDARREEKSSRGYMVAVYSYVNNVSHVFF